MNSEGVDVEKLFSLELLDYSEFFLPVEWNELLRVCAMKLIADTINKSTLLVTVDPLFCPSGCSYAMAVSLCAVIMLTLRESTLSY